MLSLNLLFAALLIHSCISGNDRICRIGKLSLLTHHPNLINMYPPWPENGASFFWAKMFSIPLKSYPNLCPSTLNFLDMRACFWTPLNRCPFAFEYVLGYFYFLS